MIDTFSIDRRELDSLLNRAKEVYVGVGESMVVRVSKKAIRDELPNRRVDDQRYSVTIDDRDLIFWGVIV